MGLGFCPWCSWSGWEDSFWQAPRRQRPAAYLEQRQEHQAPLPQPLAVPLGQRQAPLLRGLCLHQ